MQILGMGKALHIEFGGGWVGWQKKQKQKHATGTRAP